MSGAGFLYTMCSFGLAGLASRMLSLGLQNGSSASMFSGRTGLNTAGWMAAWIAAGYSYSNWKTKQELAYVQRLEQLVERKERRDKWDRLYFNEES